MQHRYCHSSLGCRWLGSSRAIQFAIVVRQSLLGPARAGIRDPSAARGGRHLATSIHRALPRGSKSFRASPRYHF